MEEWTPAYFSPPLAAERNGWILNQLRQHSLRTILDIGCGEGSLLRSLCEPSIDRYDPRTPLDADVSPRPLYPTLIGGIDVEERAITAAAERTVPRIFDPDAPRFSTDGHPRWDELRVQLWHGGIETINQEFLDKYRCFVSTEVVEHVPEEVLGLFLPIVLGFYRPEFLLLTTPNYLYNELFSPPGVPNETGYPDPTGNTTRIFRHSDHKREWTPTEWRKWCERGALAYGYEIQLGSIGWLGRPDPYQREAHEGGTLTAVFRRADDRVRALPTSSHSLDVSLHHVELTISQPQRDNFDRSELLPGSVPHRLIADHIHTAHASAGMPQAAEDILERVRDVFRVSPDNELSLEFIWLVNDVDVACGGVPRALVNALLSSPPVPTPEPTINGEAGPTGGTELEWEITQGSQSDLLTWIVLWRRWIPPTDLSSGPDNGTWDGTIEEDEYEWPADHNGSANSGFDEWPNWHTDVPARANDWGSSAQEETHANEWSSVDADPNV